MAGRPQKNTVDYFPHDCDASSRKTLFIIERRWGNDGYAFWYKLLSLLGRTENHFIDLNNIESWEFLKAETHLSDISVTEMLDVLAKLAAIDASLWSIRIIWSQNFVDRLSPVYAKRKMPIPQKPEFPSRKLALPEQELQVCSITGVNPGQKFGSVDISVTENTQSKVKESKVKEDRVHCTGKSTSCREVVEVIDHLNQVLGSAYRHESKETTKYINARLKDGYTVDQLKKVIDIKSKQWIGTDQAKYLRPSTLFNGEKCEGYINEIIISENTDNGYNASWDKDLNSHKSPENKSNYVNLGVGNPVDLKLSEMRKQNYLVRDQYRDIMISKIKQLKNILNRMPTQEEIESATIEIETRGF